MSGWLKKAKDAVSGHSEEAASAIEEHLTPERVDSVLERVPGGAKLKAKVPDDLNEKAADAVRENLGKEKAEG